MIYSRDDAKNIIDALVRAITEECGRTAASANFLPIVRREAEKMKEKV